MARTPKLKVFRTPIGFHDAYVAAPSQKAALAAWGAESNLFAQGIAEIVTDEALAAEALAHPGQVIRKLRGSASEQVAALEQSIVEPRSPRKAAVAKRPRRRRAPRPTRDAVDAAEAALAAAEARHRVAQDDIRLAQEALDARRQQLEQDHRRDWDRLAAALEKARDAYRRATAAWTAEGDD